MKKTSLVFAPSKVDIHHRRTQAYLNEEKIYPITIELDLTQLCSRACSGCPYGSKRKSGLTLQVPFMDRLFSILGPHTRGIVLSGGEPTISPYFVDALVLAEKKGFKEIAVISNGANIHLPRIQEALLEYATSIRISMYEWQECESEHFIDTLKKIETLRKKVDTSGSRLEIAASVLTRREWNHSYFSVGLKALDSGIHWLYFHPYCIHWDETHPTQADQTGVLDALRMLREKALPEAVIQVPYARYNKKPLYFERLHGSHFLIQVGADGINYAGPECKYEKDAVLLDLNQYLKDDFLWHPQRISRLNAMNSSNYRFIGTKHRPPVFSDYIQKLIEKGCSRVNSNETDESEPPFHFAYPNII
ncbi:MAG: radical SAM protein [Candidatus Aminicenantes bacterium]|nr:radical SAM protein [Candidatus Aminicenantes bacterium]